MSSAITTITRQSAEVCRIRRIRKEAAHEDTHTCRPPPRGRSEQGSSNTPRRRGVTSRIEDCKSGRLIYRRNRDRAFRSFSMRAVLFAFARVRDIATRGILIIIVTFFRTRMMRTWGCCSYRMSHDKCKIRDILVYQAILNRKVLYHFASNHANF